MNDIESFGMKGAGSKMPHSHSTPAGVDGGSRTPPATPRKAGKMLAVRVQMLDDSITMFQVQVKDRYFISPAIYPPRLLASRLHADEDAEKKLYNRG